MTMTTSLDSLEAYLATCRGRSDYFEFDTELEARQWVSIMEERVRNHGRSSVVFEIRDTRVLAWLTGKQ